MHTATFKIATHLRFIAVFMVFYLGAIIAGQDLFKATIKSHQPPSTKLLIVIAGAIILAFYLSHLVGKIRLVLSSSGIELTNLPFNIGVWKHSWKDINESLLIFAPAGGHKLLLKGTTKDRIILFPLWGLDNTTLNIQKDSSPFFKWTRNRPAEEFALYQAVKYFQPNMRDASSREATEIIQKQMDLGKEAGVVSAIAVLFVLVGLLIGMINKSRTLDAGYLDIFCGVLALSLAYAAFIYMKKCPHKLANIFICLLLAGSFFWGIRSSINTATYYFGEEQTFEYRLDKETFDHQEWNRIENPKLTIEIFADEDNRVYNASQGVQRVTLKRSPFQNYCISYDTLYTFVKDPNKRRARSNAEANQ